LSGLTNETTGVGATLCLPLESKARRDQDLNIALGYLHILGAELDLAKLSDQRLIRRFRSAAELSFFANPCEKPVLDADVMASIDAKEPRQAHVERSIDPASHIRELSPDSGRTAEDTSRPGGSSLPPYVDAKSVFLDVLQKQTGFPIEALTDDLRMVDDLHMDSIKTVQVVVDAAVALGYAGDFDPTELVNSTLGEIAQDLERRMASAKTSRSGSISPTRAAAISESYPSWTRGFAMEWEDALLPEEAPDFWEDRSVCILDDGSDAATELWATIRSKGSEVTAVPTVAASDCDTDVVIAVLSDATKGADAKARFNEVTGVLSSIAKGLASSASADTPRTIVFVQRRAAVVDNFDWGYDAFVATLHLERRGVHFRVLTVDESMSSERLCSAIARETATDRTYDSALYVGEMRRIARPQVVRRRALTRRSQQLSADDVVVVTGGARGITAECALALARKTGARMVLAGSSPHPEDAPEAGSETEIRKTLERFQHEALRAEYVQCDVTDREDVARLVKAARRHKGHVAAVMHGAAVNRPRRANNVSADEARNEIGPKLVGALNLFDALHDDPPEIFCAFTSIIGVTGMANNAWYAFANQALDRSLGAFAETHPEMTAISIAFSIWEEVGMGAKLGSVQSLAKLGTDAIPVEEGVSRFLDTLEHDAGHRQLIVSGRLGGIDTWRPESPSLPTGHRFLEEIRFIQPGVEVVSRARLSLERDSYLVDHEYKGVNLFPTVFGVEAMAQAAAYALGRRALGSVVITDLDLARPLPVHPERGLQIEVWARVIKVEENTATVRCGVRCESNGFTIDHFAGTFSIRDLLVEKEPPRSSNDYDRAPLAL
ncbi:MAG: SDR family NAD(P)-dependent oxidoreductase, partial [Myxococcales bacterium]|nr:SDR family NAD(P)-dependent oxidoreductase [Myxococcales bacterium]